MLSPHETFTKATHLILFLRTEDWLSRFYAARVKTGKAQTEHMFSGSPPLADINESRQHFRIVQERL